jgi:prophage regulatory protein
VPADPVTSPQKFLRLPSVLSRVPYSRPNLYRLIRLGRFPRPVSLGGRAVAWVESEVDGWMAERLAARDAEQK